MIFADFLYYIRDMKKIIFFIFAFIFSYCLADTSGKDSSIQTPKIRTLCTQAQELEREISDLESEISIFDQREKNSAPILKSTYEILTRCFTLLFDLQRFSKFLVINSQENKNDFVRCSIIIKNFSSYFKSVSGELSKNTREIIALKQKKINKIKELEQKKNKYEELKKNIKDELPEVTKDIEENIIKNVVYHIATKSNSIDELDAELESENAIGVLKNTKINTELSLAYPATGKLVTEFGDKGKNGEMIYCISFETRKGAIITSPAKGLVVFSGKFLNYGNMIIISNGEYRVFLYGVSDDAYTKTGDVVEIGDYIGTMNDETQGDKTVIMMELRKSGESLDPRHWLQQTLEKENKGLKIVRS